MIDVVPNEETLGALLAFEIADAMVPKPAQDQYGFSDILKLTPTEALKKLSFVDKPEEDQKNSEKAMELLKKSAYGDKLTEVTPINLHLTRYVVSSAKVEHSIVPKSAFPIAGQAGRD